MLDKIDLDKKTDKEEYKKQMEELEIQLGILQRKARDLKIPVIVVFEGWDAAGKGTLINNLILPLDPRGFTVYKTVKPNEEEKYRPFLWRFWTKLPAAGRISVFDTSWYKRVYIDRANGKIKDQDLSDAFTDIKAFENQLSDYGYLIVKFFLHISKKEQGKRMKKLDEDKNTSWRVKKKDWKHHKEYAKFLSYFGEMIESTDTEHAPWTIVESTDRNFATLKIIKALMNSINEKIDGQAKAVKEVKIQNENAASDKLNTSILDKTDMSHSLDKNEYEKLLKKYQDRLRELEYIIYSKRLPVIICYEGWDAAGKGGNIRRLIQNLDPRGYEVIPVAAPNDTERSYHYLWRFMIRLPKAGHIAIFDRTWYGRVMVERVEGFCSENEWKRAYKEINEMERHLTNFGTVLIKFWLNIDKEEQLKRFNERQSISYKNWKITDEDWRNREKWDIYKNAVDEMLYRTGTTYAPWTVVESNSKYFARIKVLKTVIDRIEQALYD